MREKGFFRLIASTFLACFRRVFHRRKIIVISEQNIRSLPFSGVTQFVLVVFTLAGVVWVSYSSGRYFTYQRILSEKEDVILDTSMTNKDLLYQVTNLRQNLLRLNNYFDHVSEYDQLTDEQKKILEKSSQKQHGHKEEEESGSDKVSQLQDTTIHSEKEELLALRQSSRDIIDTIYGRIHHRIFALENIISMTGLKVDDVAAHSSYELNVAEIEENSDIDAASENAQGGPFIPEANAALPNQNWDGPSSSGQTFDSQIEYLLMLEEMVHRFPLSLPVKKARMTSGFGKRKDPIRKTWAMHYGLDFAAPFKAQIYSTAPGKVLKAGRNGAYGLFVEIDHGFGITTRYGHLSKVLVKRGQVLDRGEPIGLQGNSGRSTGSHLHYEIRYKDTPYNPKKFLKAGEHVF